VQCDDDEEEEEEKERRELKRRVEVLRFLYNSIIRFVNTARGEADERDD